MVVLEDHDVRRLLTPRAALDPVREAMVALSSDRVRQLLRSFIAIDQGKTFAIMPAALLDRDVFGAKLVSVFADGLGRKAHQGLVVLFEGRDGAPICVADAGEVTALRTAAASAVATQALARVDADHLAVLGCGRQAQTHIEAIAQVRALKVVTVWGRDLGRSAAFASEVAQATGLRVEARATVAAAVADASIICTVSAAIDPILEAACVPSGAHVNVVGSSGPSAAEIDSELVRLSRFVVDHREHALVHAGEFLRAQAAGLVGADHIAAEIGEVLSGRVIGRQDSAQITVYKSLGHAVQDLAVTAWLYEQVSAD